MTHAKVRALPLLALLPFQAAPPLAAQRDLSATLALVREWRKPQKRDSPNWRARLESLARAGNTTAATFEALLLMQSGGDTSQVLARLRGAAAMGNPRAMLVLAELGRGLAKTDLDAARYGVDAVEAIGWLNLCLTLPSGPSEAPPARLAALQQEVQTSALATLDRAAWKRLSTWRPPSVSRADLDRSVAHGDPYALTLRAHLLFEGRLPAPGAPEAEAEALLWEAARQDMLAATCRLAQRHLLSGRPLPPVLDHRSRGLVNGLLDGAQADSLFAMHLLATIQAQHAAHPFWARLTLAADFGRRAAQAGIPEAMAYHAQRLWSDQPGDEAILEGRRWLALAAERDPTLRKAVQDFEAEARNRDLAGRPPEDPRRALWSSRALRFEGSVPAFPPQVTGPR